MIAKGSTTIVNFYAQTNAGLPATGQASNISASISIDGGTATTISATISEKDSTNLPGWYEFEYTFSTAGNAFITFSCSDCVIMPWEEQVVEISASSAPSASDIANAVWTKDINSYNYNTTPGMAYKYLKGFDLLLTNVSFAISNIPADVWNYSSGRTITNTIPTANNIASAVWTYTIYKNDVAYIAGNLLSSIDNISLNITNAVSTLETYGDGNWTTASGFATSTALSAVASDVSAVKAKTDNLPASPAAKGDIPSVASIQSGLAKTSDLSGLSTFDPSTDTVLIDATQAATMQTATGFATPNDIPSDYAKPGDAMTLTSAYDAAKTAAQAGDAMTLTSAYEAAKTASQLTLADIPSDYAKPGDAMTLTSAYNAAKTASQLTSADLPSDYAKPGDAMTLTSAYDAAKTASQLTSADLSGLSTFDPTTDTVLIDATQAATMTTATGFATSSDVSGAVSALETYGDNHWSGGGSGGATAQQIWEYPGPRSLNVSPTDVSGLATSSALSAVASDVSDIKAKTDNLPASPAAVGSAMTLTSAYDAAKTASQLTSADLSGLATSSALSAVASDVSAVKAKTDNLPASPAATGDIPTSKIDSVYAGIYNWRLQNNGTVEKITAKDATGNTLAQSTITRDNDGNIIRMDEETE